MKNLTAKLPVLIALVSSVIFPGQQAHGYQPYGYQAPGYQAPQRQYQPYQAPQRQYQPYWSPYQQPQQPQQQRNKVWFTRSVLLAVAT
jgi:hypothetical protein